MGKKGKRSKKKDERGKILRECDKLMCGAFDYINEHLYSKGISQFRAVVRLVESKKELMKVYNSDDYTFGRMHFITYFLLMYYEYQRHHYKEAIDCYNNFMAHPEDISPYLRSIGSLYYQLIILRLHSKECQVSDFINYITPPKDDTIPITCPENIFMAAVFAFRAHKQYDFAIRLEVARGSLILTPFKSKISLALTCLEQYRVEFRQRSQMRKGDIPRITSLVDSLVTEYPPSEGRTDLADFVDFADVEYCLVLAQFYYLTRNSNSVQEEESIAKALKCVKRLLPVREGKIVQDRCYTCYQAVTPDEVQFVCSGCRVACYCSIDHQRATWKKEAVKGTRIGHEILCPLYKAFRKYKLEKVSQDRDEEKESKMQRRLDRECVKFLEYGLGLKNKCFSCEY
ncbi:predicted protein [Chaetoceros tenuissimus]|uniref:MYND-type domain-containing protein n=1 Tax=Chaetoceros tenuissimus TaxID=426638 RepID=A0AAD3D5W7_9STRA|nr:predicted protein [Chaetoceros tenuissimus]